MVVRDGGGAICASLGLEGIAERHQGHGDTGKLREQLDSLYEDFTAGLMSYSEFGHYCGEYARMYAGWWER